MRLRLRQVDSQEWRTGLPILLFGSTGLFVSKVEVKASLSINARSR